MRTYGNVGTGTNAGAPPDLTRTLSGLPLGDMAPVRTGTGLRSDDIRHGFLKAIARRKAARKRMHDAGVKWGDVRAWALLQGELTEADLPSNGFNIQATDSYLAYLKRTQTRDVAS